MRAMVIDDSRAMRMILKRIVGKLGFEAIEAADGQEALDLLDTWPRCRTWPWSTGTCRS